MADGEVEERLWWLRKLTKFLSELDDEEHKWSALAVTGEEESTAKARLGLTPDPGSGRSGGSGGRGQCEDSSARFASCRPWCVVHCIIDCVIHFFGATRCVIQRPVRERPPR